MKKLFLFYFPLILFSCGSPSVKKEAAKNNSDTSNVIFRDSGYSSITILGDSSGDEKRLIKIKNTRTYNVVSVKRGTEYERMLITENSKQKSLEGGEGEEGVIELSGRISENGNFKKEIWKKSIPANMINYDWDYLEADN